MKKAITAVLLALLLLISCGCAKAEEKDDVSAKPDTLGQFFDDHEDYIVDDSEDETVINTEDRDEEEDFSFIEGIPEDWTTQHEGCVYLSYPEDDFVITESFGADFLIMEKGGRSNINIINSEGDNISIYDIDDEYIERVLEYSMPLLESTYESALNAECETEGTTRGAEVRTFGNAECACISYVIVLTASELDVEFVIDYYQIMYVDSEQSCTVTFTHFTEDGTTAEEYFGDIIDALYFE